MSLGTVKALLAEPHTTDDTQIYACGYGSIAVADLRELAAKAEQANAMVAAAYEAAATMAQTTSMLDKLPAHIRALTPTDAKAALDRLIAEAVKEALTVKPLVWGYHPMGQMASAGMGTAYIIDTRDLPRIRWGKWPGGHGPERETLEEMQHAAQADYEARILSALKGGEA